MTVTNPGLYHLNPSPVPGSIPLIICPCLGRVGASKGVALPPQIPALAAPLAHASPLLGGTLATGALVLALGLLL